MAFFYRGLIALLVGLIAHASILAALPLVWCVGTNGHNALELSVAGGHHGHHRLSEAQETARTTLAPARQEAPTLASHAQPIDCIDTVAIDTFGSVSLKVQLIDLCSRVATLAPWAILPATSRPILRLTYLSSVQDPAPFPNLAQLRSIILLI